MAENDFLAPDVFDVIVLGYGPVGASLANLLVQQGMRVAVLEREASVYHLARAGHFDAEVMRIFQSIGIAEKLEPTTGISLASRFVDADGALLMESKRSTEKGPLGWVSDYMFFQPTLEAYLRTELEESEAATILLRHDVFSVRDEGSHVVVEAEDLATGRLVTLRGKYIVGCDGARSLVRRTIGSEHEDLGFSQRWLVVDVKQNRDLGFEEVSTHHCNPERPMFTSVLSQGVLRWEVMLKDSDNPAEVTSPESIWGFINDSTRPMSPSDGTITRSAIYMFESLLAHQWRKGRLLIAGDSAHRTPPFLGQGMCAGIRDAANLAWKLAAIVFGRADDALLDSYEIERKPHVREFIAGAVDAGRILHMSKPEELRARARDMRDSPKDFAPPNPPLGPGLSSAYGKGRIGWQFPQPVVDDKLMDEHLGHAFALVYSEGFLDQSAIEYLAAQYPLLRRIALKGDASCILREQYQVQAALLRPDRYVHALASTWDQIVAMLDTMPVRQAARDSSFGREVGAVSFESLLVSR